MYDDESKVGFGVYVVGYFFDFFDLVFDIIIDVFEEVICWLVVGVKKNC